MTKTGKNGERPGERGRRGREGETDQKEREREEGGLCHPAGDFLTDTYSSPDVVSFEVHPPMSLQRRGDLRR